MRKILFGLVATAFLASPSAYGHPLAPPEKQPLPVKRIHKLVVEGNKLAVLDGRIEEVMASNLSRRLKQLDTTPGPITLVINSPGGSIRAGTKIIKAMEILKNPLVCIVDDSAFSMAAMISTYCPTLYAYKFSLIMFHEAAMTVQGNESEIRTQAKLMETLMREFKHEIAKNLGMSPEDYAHRIHDEWWLTGQEGASIGFVDAIVERVVYQNIEETALQKVLSVLNRLL